MEIVIWYFLIGVIFGGIYAITLASDAVDATLGGIALTWIWPALLLIAPFALIFVCLYKWRRT